MKNVADRFASPVDMVKAIIDLRTDNSQRVKIPAADAPPEEIAKYRKAVGIPESADKYEIALPEGVALSELDKQVLDAVIPLAHQANIPNAALNAFVGEFAKLSAGIQEGFTKQLEEFGTKSVEKLKTEWGKDFEPNVQIAKRTVVALGGDEFKEFLNSTPVIGGGMLGDHPMMVRLLAGIGRRMNEGDLMIGSATPEQQADIKKAIAELNSKVPPGSQAYTSKEHQQQLAGLYDKLYGRAGIIGAAGRTA